jgi:hypothetical protein
MSSLHIPLTKMTAFFSSYTLAPFCTRRLLGPNLSFTRVVALRFPPRESITGTKGRKCVKLVYARSPELIFRTKPSAHPPSLLLTGLYPQQYSLTIQSININQFPTSTAVSCPPPKILPSPSAACLLWSAIKPQRATTSQNRTLQTFSLK